MRSISLWNVFIRLVYIYTMFQPVWTRESIHGFHYFETITHINRQSRVRKSTHVGVDALEYASFKAFNRSFDIVLKPGTDVLAEGFKAYVIEANGQASRLFINVNDHFNGHLLDDPDVVVDGHMEDTMIALTIFDRLDTYAIEPSKIYRKEAHSHEDQTWIAYRLSDTYMDGIGVGMDLNSISNESFCGNKHGPKKGARQNYSQFGKKFRNKRFAGHRKRKSLQVNDELNTCTMMVVATYDLFVERCKRSGFICAQLLISNVVFADYVFRTTDFGQYTGIRLNVKEDQSRRQQFPDFGTNSYKPAFSFDDLKKKLETCFPMLLVGSVS